MTTQNASGLTPEQSKALKERDIKDYEQPIITALKELYSCKPKDTTYDIYTKDAVFHDPVGYAEGADSIRAQFDALPKLFPRADIEKFKVLENPANSASDVLLIDQDVAYYRDPNSSSPTKTVNSLLTLNLDQTRKVSSHTEEWNHQRQTTSDDGFFGMLNEYRKKATARITHKMMGSNNANNTH